MIENRHRKWERLYAHPDRLHWTGLKPATNEERRNVFFFFFSLHRHCNRVDSISLLKKKKCCTGKPSHKLASDCVLNQPIQNCLLYNTISCRPKVQPTHRDDLETAWRPNKTLTKIFATIWFAPTSAICNTHSHLMFQWRAIYLILVYLFSHPNSSAILLFLIKYFMFGYK